MEGQGNNGNREILQAENEGAKANQNRAHPTITPTNNPKPPKTTKKNTKILSKYVGKHSKRENSRLNNAAPCTAVIPQPQPRQHTAQASQHGAQPRAAQDKPEATPGRRGGQTRQARSAVRSVLSF